MYVCISLTDHSSSFVRTHDALEPSTIQKNSSSRRSSVFLSQLGHERMYAEDRSNVATATAAAVTISPPKEMRGFLP